MQVAQRTRRLVSEMAETVNHKQIPVYFDQMVDDVFLNGTAKGAPEAAARNRNPPSRCRRSRRCRRCSALAPQNDSVNAPIAMFSRHNGGWTVVFSIADPTLGISWRIGEAGDFRETGFMDTLDPRTRKRMPNPSIELPADAPQPPSRCAMSTRQARCRDRSRSGSIQGRPDPRPAQDPRHDRDQLAVVSRVQRAARLLHSSMSYRCAIREVRIGIDSTVPDKVLKMPPCDPRDPSVIPSDAQPYLKLAPHEIGFGGTDLSRRQRVRDQEFPAVADA